MRKLNPYLCALAALLTCCSRSSGPSYEGNLDTVNCDIIAGWVWDANEANKQLSVTISDGDTLLASVRADGLRPDLRAAGKGDGSHAFVLPAPGSIKDGRSHSIRARIAEGGSNWELAGSHRVIQCSSP
jgi:hypothetical protein